MPWKCWIFGHDQTGEPVYTDYGWDYPCLRCGGLDDPIHVRIWWKLRFLVTLAILSFRARMTPCSWCGRRWKCDEKADHIPF